MQNLAKHVQAQGRGNDTMLVHMTPGEVGGLQSLAKAAGGSLTINPHTGLPEAGFLSNLLPTLAGAAGMFLGIPPMISAGLVAAGEGVANKSLTKGLMAGLQAYGGASLAGGLGVGGASGAPAVAANAAAPAALNPTLPTLSGIGTDAVQAVPGGMGAAASNATSGVAGLSGLSGGAGDSAIAAGADPELAVDSGALAPSTPGSLPLASPQASVMGAGAPASGFPSGLKQFGSQFANTAQQGVPSFLSPKMATVLAGMGAASGVLGAMQPNYSQINTNTSTASSYKGPYMAAPRTVQFPTNRAPGDTSEFQYFDPVNPYPSAVPASSLGMAAGGHVPLKDGAFIVDARTVSELGNGSSSAGQELLAKHGGKTLHGPGDGVSDSIRANIGGVQEARVARDEVKFDPEDVARIGGGDPNKGTKKLYNLMDKAQSARKRAGRGADTNMRKELAALG